MLYRVVIGIHKYTFAEESFITNVKLKTCEQSTCSLTHNKREFFFLKS